MSEKENKIVDFKEKVALTESQKLIILEMLNNENAETPKIKEILDRVFPGENLDARSKKGIIVREFIAEKGLDYREAKEWVVKKDIQLTEEQKQYITNNIKSEKPLQMARVLFNNHNLTNLDSETRAIYSYIKELPSLVKAGSLDKQNYNVEEYKPPKTDDQCISRINQYVDNEPAL